MAADAFPSAKMRRTGELQEPAAQQNELLMAAPAAGTFRVRCFSSRHDLTSEWRKPWALGRGKPRL